MGTDVYLTWKGMTDEDRQKQCTGFSIDAGSLGYMRASIGMVNENTVLRTLFPEEFWDMTDEDREKGGVLFNFLSEENLTLVHKLAIQYFLVVVTGKEISHPSHAQAEAMHSALVEMLGKVGFDRIEMDGALDLDSAVMWLNSLFQFYRFGCSLQEDGKEPRVYISW